MPGTVLQSKPNSNASAILTLLPGGHTQKREEGRLFVQCEGPVVESHHRDRQAVVQKSVYPKPSQ